MTEYKITVKKRGKGPTVIIRFDPMPQSKKVEPEPVSLDELFDKLRNVKRYGPRQYGMRWKKDNLS